MQKIFVKFIVLLLYTIGIYLLAFSCLYFSGKINRVMDYIIPTGRDFHSLKSFGDFVNKTEKYDVIILGSSHAYRGYDPRIFRNAGLNIYNLGSSSQRIGQTYIIANNLVKTESANLVLLDISDISFTSPSLESSIYLIQNLPTDKSAVQTAYQTYDLRAINMFTFRLFNFYFKKFKPKNIKGGKGYIDKGFMQTLRSDSAVNLAVTQPNRNFVYDHTSFIVLSKLIQLLKNRGIKVVLTSAPVLDRFLPLNNTEYLYIVKNIANKNKVEFWDYSKLISDTTKYYDSHHLNQEGVNTFNRKLLLDKSEFFNNYMHK